MKWLLMVCTVAMMIASTNPGAAAVPIVPRYAKFEASFTLPDVTGNPFDPAENDVWATLTGPGDAVVRVPAFWDGDAGWKVRFAPTVPGSYTLAIERNGKRAVPITLSPSSFVCVESDRAGFIRRDPAHAQRFVFDSGRTYYPLGCDQAWRSRNLPDYPATFAAMREQGMNWARVWMTFWDGKALDWAPSRAESPVPGRFLLDAARYWDQILDAADDAGIYLQVVLQHHGQFTRVVDSNWRDNPFNLQNPGGFLAEPQDFFTDPRALALTRAKYRYVIARYGYSTSIMGWELFNEVQNNPELKAHYDRVLGWHREMAALLRGLDPNRHLVTTSYSDCGDPIEVAADLDYDQPHNYVSDIVGLFASRRTAGCTKPVFYGEWGAQGNHQSAGFLHRGLWAGIMAPMAGAPQYWYWDFVAENDLWHEYGAIARFLTASRLPEFPEAAPATPRIAADQRGDVTFAPPRGWEATVNYQVTISPSTGEAESLSGVSSFLQGSAHREMVRQPIDFDVDYASPGEFEVTFGVIARAGAHPQILLDGQLAAEKDYPASDRDHPPADATLTIDVPAGRHQISLYNPERDWAVISQIRLTGYAPALAAVAKSTPNALFFWAYRRPGGAVSAPLSGELAFDGLARGTYRLHLWDTHTGAPLGPSRKVRVGRGALRVRVTDLTGDVAGWAVRS